MVFISNPKWGTPFFCIHYRGTVYTCGPYEVYSGSPFVVDVEYDW